MHAYAELLDPGVVSHALFVTLAGEPCLVLVRGASLLQVYSEIHSPLGPRWLAEFALDGAVTQLDTLNGANLVVTFKSAKLVLLDWDADSVSFVTRSLHYYEKLAESLAFGTGAGAGAGAGAGMQDTPVLAVDRAKHSIVFRFERDLAALVTRRDFANPLFPELLNSPSELKSAELPLMPLVPNEECSEIVHVAFMPTYTVPTIAVLYWTEPSWEGLVPKHGDRTKALVVASMWGADQTRAVLTVRNIRLDVFKIVPVRTQGSLILLIGSSTLSYVDEAGVLSDIPLEGDDALLRFEDCEAVELPNSEWVVLALQSGAVLAVSMVTYKIQHLKPAGFVPEPTCIAVSDEQTLVIGSRLKNCAFCRADIEPASGPKVELTANFSVRAVYDWMAGRATKPATLLGLTTLFSFKNIGALTAITPIDDGVACSSGDSVVIVERELPLIEQDRIEPAVDLSPGRFWILNDSKPDSKLLLVSSKTLDRLERDGEQHSDADEAELQRKSSKRRNTKQARESTLFYDDLFAAKKDTSNRHSRQRPKQIRAFATDQATLAVHEGSEVVVVVQTRSLSAYETGSWRFLSATPIPTAYFAEIQNDYIITQHREGHEAHVYSCTDLSLLKTVPNVEHAAICKSFLITSNKSWVTLSSPTSSSDSGKSYNLTNLDRVVVPQDIAAASDEDVDLIAIFALEYSGTNYIGIHQNRLFCVYELVGDLLLKRFTVPFMVNQSPVWLPAAQLLVFLGPQCHALVKSRESKFACHPLQTDGLFSLDITACSENSSSDKSKSDSRRNNDATPSFVWLDDRQRLHFSCLDTDVDYLSNRLPYRRITVDPNIVIQNLAYHDDTQALVIGANRLVKYDAPSTTPEDGEDTEMKDDEVAEEDEDDAAAAAGNGEEEGTAATEMQEEPIERESSPPPEAFTGCVYMLPLSSYKALEMTDVKLERYETIVTIECVDHCDAGGRQLVALGTAKVTEEDLQCNGNIYLYRVDEPRESTEKESDHEEEDPEKLALHLFAKDYLRGAVSSIAEVMGFLAVAHGQQIRVYNFHKELEPVGFFDTEVYMKDMKAVRNLLLLGEEFRGPRLVNFGLQPHRMDLLCSSEVAHNVHAPLTSVAGVSNAYKGDLCMVSCDASGRLQVLQYDPENLESAGGTRFVPLASFHTGRQCLGFAAVELANEDLVAYGATQDGVLFSVSPIPEEAFRTLFVLTQQMMDKEQSLAGMNPRAHRQMLATPGNHEHHLIDFNYAQRLWNLPVDRQIMYSRKLGYNGLNRAHRVLNSGGRDSLKL